MAAINSALNPPYLRKKDIPLILLVAIVVAVVVVVVFFFLIRGRLYCVVQNAPLFFFSSNKANYS